MAEYGPLGTWEVPEGYEGKGIGPCRSCGELVHWTLTKAGKRAPLNRDGTSHFATCPQADQWRRSRG